MLERLSVMFQVLDGDSRGRQASGVWVGGEGVDGLLVDAGHRRPPAAVRASRIAGWATG